MPAPPPQSLLLHSQALAADALEALPAGQPLQAVAADEPLAPLLLTDAPPQDFTGTSAVPWQARRGTPPRRAVGDAVISKGLRVDVVRVAKRHPYADNGVRCSPLPGDARVVAGSVVFFVLLNQLRVIFEVTDENLAIRHGFYF